MQEISKKAILGKNVKLGHCVKIYDNVIIGDNCTIEDFCVLGYPAPGIYAGRLLELKENSIIRTHSVLYEGSQFGKDLHVGHHSLVREGVKAGVDLQIGSFNDIEGECEIGHYCRFHSNVHVGKGSKIGNLVWFFPNVVLTNDPLPPSGLTAGVTIGDGVVLCTGSVILPGKIVKRGAVVAAMTRVSKNVSAGTVVLGEECKNIGKITGLFHLPSGKQHPWMFHFNWAYPEEAQALIAELGTQVNADLQETLYGTL